MTLKEERNELRKDLTEALDLLAELKYKYGFDDIDEEYAQELIDREVDKYGERLDEYIIQD